MQCKLVETSTCRSSALIGTAGDCCVVSECIYSSNKRLTDRNPDITHHGKFLKKNSKIESKTAESYLCTVLET